MKPSTVKSPSHTYYDKWHFGKKGIYAWCIHCEKWAWAVGAFDCVGQQ